MKRLAIIALAALAVSACAKNKDTSEPPAALISLNHPIPVEKVWIRKVGKGSQQLSVQLAPAISDNMVYAADRAGVVEAYTAADGKERWNVALKAPLSSGPAVGDDAIYFGAADGRVLALNASDGKLRWESQLSTEVLGAPVVAGDRVIVHTIDEHVFGLDAKTGTRVWAYAESSPALTLRGSSSPVVVGDLAITGFDNGKLVALKVADGTPVWSTSVAQPSGRTDLERMADVDGTPLVIGNIIYTAAYQGKVAAIEADSGRVIWERELSVYSSFVADDANLYIVDDKSVVWALALADGQIVWKLDGLRMRGLTSPAIAGGHLFVGDTLGFMHVVDKTQGKVVGRKKLDKAGLAAAPIAEAGTVYFLGRSGLLSAMKLEGVAGKNGG